MYGQGNFPPPYRHSSQGQAPNQMGPSGPPGRNPSYPVPTSHSYPIPHSTQQILPPPPRLPFPPQQQQLYQSPTTLPPNFAPAPPPPPNFAPAPPPPPPPSLPPPPMPPPPPEVAPEPRGEEVPDRESLGFASCINLEKEKAGSVSPALSDMDMEDDDVPISDKETSWSNREILVKPSLENKELDDVKEVFHGSQSMIKEHVEEPLHGSQSINNTLGGEADAVVNARTPNPLPQTSTVGSDMTTPFMEDVSPARSSLTPVECVIDANTNSKLLEENPNPSPFQLLQQDYGSLDSGDDVDNPTSDKEIENTDKNNVKHTGKEIDGRELNVARNGKRLLSNSPSESPRKRIKSPMTSSFHTQQTEMPPVGSNPSHIPSGNPVLISAQEPSQQMWTHLPPPPPLPLAPHMQHVHNPLHPTSDFTTNLVAPYPPVEPPQNFPLPFPSHAERWPHPSMSVPINLPPSFPTNTSTGAAVSTSTLLPSFTGSTITTRYNPYASTFETIPPPPPPFTISSNLPGQGFSTSYSAKYGTVKHSTSGTPYDPLSDSIEPIKKSNPVPVPDQLSSKLATVSEADELGEEVVGEVENLSPEPIANPSPSGTGTVTGSKEKNKEESRSMKLLKVALADYVKEVLKPAWRQGNISKDAFKTIVKKTVDKVAASVPSRHIPKTPSKINQYVETSQQKVTKLVMSYVDKYVKKQL
ncbi:uncharacterized protein LOC144552570 isoform X2 [Carex rostrata]